MKTRYRHSRWLCTETARNGLLYVHRETNPRVWGVVEAEPNNPLVPIRNAKVFNPYEKDGVLQRGSLLDDQPASIQLTLAQVREAIGPIDLDKRKGL